MPKYFNFLPILDYVTTQVGNQSFAECLSENHPERLEQVNLEFLQNKDGRYGVRPITLANPYLYYLLARELCNEEGWSEVQECFKAYRVPHLTCAALPLIPPKKEAFHQSTAILNWWSKLEQRTIELSLDYRYMFVTDITNCYGCVNIQSIGWALSCRGTQKERTVRPQMVENIEQILRAFQRGQNIGIPQGSVLFDFVAEIVLGYADLQLHEALKQAGLADQCEIIRYRDDYRIFCNDRDALQRISYLLQGILERLNFRMNTQKTKISDSIVTDALKPDKLGYIYNTPIFNKKGCDFDSFEKHLYYILVFGRNFPGDGQVRTMLSDFDQRLETWLNSGIAPSEEAKAEVIAEIISSDEINILKTYPSPRPSHIPGGSALALSAVAVQIALENLNTTASVLRIISRLVDSVKSSAMKEQIIKKVRAKLSQTPNSVFHQLWLQNMTYTRDKAASESPYDLSLCQLVMGKTDIVLWDNSWLRPELVQNLPVAEIIDKKVLSKVTPIIEFDEIRNYDEIEAAISDFFEAAEALDEEGIENQINWEAIKGEQTVSGYNA